MSNMNDTDDKDGGHHHTAGVNVDDQKRLWTMVNRLKQKPGEEVFDVFATVGSAALAADTLRRMGYSVRHNVLAVEVESSRSPSRSRY